MRTAEATPPVPFEGLVATFQDTLQRRVLNGVSPQFLLVVLALWYSRAAFGRCYSGATCHTAGENSLEAV